MPLAYLLVMTVAAWVPVQASSAAPSVRIDVPPAGTIVPMLDVGGRPMVDLRINGKGPFPFILDTGASITVIDDALARELALPAGPSRGSVDTRHINELRIGDTVLHDFVASVLGAMPAFGGDNPPRGVFSALAFPGHLLELDYPHRQIRIRPGALPAADDRDVFEYPASEVLPIVPVRVGGHEYRIHLDSGAPAGVTLPMKYAGQVPLVSPPVLAGQARTRAGSFPVQTATVDGTIQVGAFTLDEKEIRFSDLRAGPAPGIGTVGGEVLRHFLVTVDSKNRRVKFARG